MKTTPFRYTIIILSLILSLSACSSSKRNQTAEKVERVSAAPAFNADSAYNYCAAQCTFGPRTMNSEAHEKCGEWIAEKFQNFGLEVIKQRADLKGYDGTIYKATNIIASLRPEATNRILLCAHWDTRPWADNDPDAGNHHTPIEGANDGASGVAVLLELARLLASDTTLAVGVDFICFDAEDSGIPQWETRSFDNSAWALGSEYWAAHPHKPGYRANYGILLDMVGGKDAKFAKEGFSMQYASGIVNKVWRKAAEAGYGKYFQQSNGGYITDDHVAVNQVARIPTIDIVPHHPDCLQSNFGPTWHTLSDNMQQIDRQTLKAVGQTVLETLFN